METLKKHIARSRAFWQAHPATYVTVGFMVAWASYGMFSGGGLVSDVLRTGIAAVFVVTMLAVCDPAVVKSFRRDVSGMVMPTLMVLGAATAVGAVWFMGAVAGGQAGLGVASCVQSFPSIVPPLTDILLFVALCVLTGVFEEALFRGIMFNGLLRGLRERGSSRPIICAAVVSSVVFGLLHVTGASATGEACSIEVAQVVMKVVQATLFGLVMVAVMLKSGSMWWGVALHALFDVVSEVPAFMMTGGLPTTYATGSINDLVGMVVSSVFLVSGVVWGIARLCHVYSVT